MSDTGSPLWQMIAGAAMNHVSRQGICKAIDWLREIPDAEVKEATQGLAPKYAVCFEKLVEQTRKTFADPPTEPPL